MSSWRFIFRSLLFHWRINSAVALGVMAATAVLTGALLVGDCVRGSLRKLTLDRLGKIDEVLVADRFFRAELATELAAKDGFKQHYSSAAPVILFPHGTIERQTSDGKTKRAARMLIVGCTESFWDFGDQSARPRRHPQKEVPNRPGVAGEIVLNEPLADDLGIAREDLEGNEPVLVRLQFAKNQQVAADFSIGKKDELVASIPRLMVIDIIPAESLGRFGLQASQRTPRNAYVSLKSVQSALDQIDKANAILVAGKSKAEFPGEKASRQLADALEPSFEDYGFVLKRATAPVPEGSNAPPVFDYFSFSSEEMILDEETFSVAKEAFAEKEPKPVFTYLANAISRYSPSEQRAFDDARSAAEVTRGFLPGVTSAALGFVWEVARIETGREVPFSMVSAVDFSPEFAPRTKTPKALKSPLKDNEIVLNSWAAEDLGARVGDTIYVTYFMPETVHGKETARTESFTLKAVVPITKPKTPYRRGREATFDEPPTLANDPDLTPYVPGVTDQESVGEWDLPFDTSGIRSKDDEYWQNYRTTPKAFLSLAKGRELWSSRFGKTTSLRIPTEGTTAEELKAGFLKQAEAENVDFGFVFIPVKREGLQAASGTTPFDVLFLSLSFFIIAAALMLVALLFRLGIEQRADEVGTLLGVGLRRRLTGRVLVVEGVFVAAAGGVLGVVVGIGYAWLMVVGLKTIWVGAVVSPFLGFHWTWTSLAIGYVSGVAISVVTIAWSIWRTRRVPVRRLLAGDATEVSDVVYKRKPWIVAIAAVCFVCAVLLTILAATTLGGETQAGAFVGGGAALLIALLLVIWDQLRQGRQRSASTDLGLAALAFRNAGRNPSRSTITIGLVAFASFLIVAMSSFRLSPTEEGVGGFDLLARSSRPIFADLNSPDDRYMLLDEQETILEGSHVLSLRLKPGDDASCNNLYQASRPRVLGVTPPMIDYFDEAEIKFKFSASAAESEADRDNPWRLLAKERESLEPVPVVIDKNTAMYSLHLYGGIGEEFEVEYEEGEKIRFRVVGLLANSVLQGSLLIGSHDFERLFPRVSGFHFFLIRSPSPSDEDVAKFAEQHGISIERARLRLQRESRDDVANVLENRLSDQGFDVRSSEEELAGLLAVQNTYLSTFQSLGALGLLLGTFGLATVQLRSVLERRRELALMRAAGFPRSRLAAMVMIENSLLLLGGLATGVISALIAVLPHMFFGQASVPLDDLLIMLAVIMLVGLASGFAAVRWTIRAPLLAALRGE